MYKLKNDTRLSHEQKLMVRNYIFDEFNIDSMYYLRVATGTVILIIFGLASIILHIANTDDISAKIITTIISILGLALDISVAVDKRTRMRSLANMISVCNSYRTNSSDQKIVETDLLNYLIIEKTSPKTKYEYKDIDFLLDFVKEALSRNVVLPETSKLHLILEDTNNPNETMKNIDAFVLSRANVLLEFLFSNCLKEKYKKRNEYEYNNPILSAEHTICCKECAKHNIDLSDDLFFQLAGRPLEEQLDIIKKLGTLKDEYKLPGLKLKSIR